MLKELSPIMVVWIKDEELFLIWQLQSSTLLGTEGRKEEGIYLLFLNFHLFSYLALEIDNREKKTHLQSAHLPFLIYISTSLGQYY